ncbi:MAG: DUF2283 domain-containing protein [Candidatus Bathyarchaeia archaeon]
MRTRYYPDADVLVIQLRDAKPRYGEPAEDRMIIHYGEDDRPVKIELLDASETILDLLHPILRQKPILKAAVK